MSGNYPTLNNDNDNDIYFPTLHLSSNMQIKINCKNLSFIFYYLEIF